MSHILDGSFSVLSKITSSKLTFQSSFKFGGHTCQCQGAWTFMQQNSRSKRFSGYIIGYDRNQNVAQEQVAQCEDCTYSSICLNVGRSNVSQCMRYVVESSNVFYRFIFLRDSIKDSSRSNTRNRSFTSTTRKRPRLPFSSVYISVRFLRTRGTLFARSLGIILYHPMHRSSCVLCFWQSI